MISISFSLFFLFPLMDASTSPGEIKNPDSHLDNASPVWRKDLLIVDCIAGNFAELVSNNPWYAGVIRR